MIVQHRNFGTQSIVKSGVHCPKHDFGNHIHEYSEILYVVEGSIESTVNGKTELLRAGDIAFITPFKVHSTFTPDSCKLVVCVVSNDYVYDMIPKEKLYRGYNTTSFTATPELKCYLDSRFVEIASRLHLLPEKEYTHIIKACVHAILAEFISCAEPGEDGSARSGVLASLLLYLNEHFREDLSLAKVSKELGYAPGYISHCLESLPNMNFSALLNSLRIDYAKKLVCETDLTNVEIAFESGFNSERSFYRAFLRHAGMTPGQYLSSKRR